MTRYNPQAYITAQQQETYRAFVVYGPAMSHKTEWARRIRDKLGAYLLDLQQYFIERKELAEKIDRFRPNDFEHLLLQIQKEAPQPVVIIDNMDFLLNLWTPAYQRTFLGMLARTLKSPGTTSKTFIFVTQDHPAITQGKLRNSRRDSRIIPLSDFEAI